MYTIIVCTSYPTGYRFLRLTIVYRYDFSMLLIQLVLLMCWCSCTHVVLVFRYVLCLWPLLYCLLLHCLCMYITSGLKEAYIVPTGFLIYMSNYVAQFTLQCRSVLGNLQLFPILFPWLMLFTYTPYEVVEQSTVYCVLVLATQLLSLATVVFIEKQDLSIKALMI